jgi:hypothetical protein
MVSQYHLHMQAQNATLALRAHQFVAAVLEGDIHESGENWFDAKRRFDVKRPRR